MKNLKILIAILCVILLINIVCLVRNKKNECNFEKYIELFDTMSDNTIEELLTKYIGVLPEEYWEEGLDIMYDRLDKLGNANSDSDYRNKVIPLLLPDYDKLNDILMSSSQYSIEEKTFIISLTEYIKVQNMLINRLNSYYHFDQLAGNPVFSLKGDTIHLGDQYSAAVPLCCVNSEYKSILVLDGDTVETDGSMNIFSEKPKQRGHVKKEGYITYFKRGEERQFPVKVEYYVK